MSFFQQHWNGMSDIQREQYHVLYALVRELRQEVLQRVGERENIAVVEPALAVPRSSLHPRFFLGEADDE